MAATPGLKVFNPSNEYVAACHLGEDAACLASLYGAGATIRTGHSKKDIVWNEGAETQPAGESFDHVAAVIAERIEQRRAAAEAAHIAPERAIARGQA